MKERARILKSLSGKRRKVATKVSFPLTLALSLGEREQAPPDQCLAHVDLASPIAGIAESRRMIPPLPRGKGRGEGNRVASRLARTSHHLIDWQHSVGARLCAKRQPQRVASVLRLVFDTAALQSGEKRGPDARSHRFGA